MASTETITHGNRKKRKRRRTRAKEQSVLSVVSVRLSDEEKERIDEIMRTTNIKRYSDVMRLAIQMVQVPRNDNDEQAGTYH